MAKVTSITSLTRSGLSDYVLQRLSAFVIFLYSLCIIGFFLTTSQLDYATFKGFFRSLPMQCFSQTVLLAVVIHAWIGLWTITTDYIRPHYFGTHESLVRMVAQALCAVALFVYLVWGTVIIWGI